jgi:hypothetical protein
MGFRCQTELDRIDQQVKFMLKKLSDATPSKRYDYREHSNGLPTTWWSASTRSTKVIRPCRARKNPRELPEGKEFQADYLAFFGSFC